MKYLEFDVKNMSITRKPTDKTPLISGAVDYYGLGFEFDEEFAAIPGGKRVEFIKKNNKESRDLVDGKCSIPNWILTDKDVFQIRVTSGNTIGTQWQQIAITEGGIIMPEEPEEEAPPTMEYVKTASGDEAAPYLRANTNGLEYSQDGENWNSGVSGVPEVKSSPKNALWARSWGDWVRIDKTLESVGNAITGVKVDGVALAPTDGAVDIDLSAYAKTADVDALQTLTGTAAQLTTLDYSETDTANIVTKINDIILALQARGVVTT